LYNLLHSKCYNFQKGFVKALWNSLWTTGNSRWTTSAVPGPHLECTDVVPPYYISGYVPVTIAGQLHFCKDGVFRGPLVTLIVMQCVDILAEHRTPAHGIMRLLCNSCDQFPIEAFRLVDGTAYIIYTVVWKE